MGSGRPSPIAPIPAKSRASICFCGITAMRSSSSPQIRDTRRLHPTLQTLDLGRLTLVEASIL
jgi:hypothetical protein